MPIIIHPCLPSDVAALETAFPTGINRLHERRRLEQERGEALYLIAWLGSTAVGHVKIRWAGSVHEGVRNVLGPVPEVRRLLIAESQRGKGTGSALLEAAESAVRDRGLAGVGLAVGVDNHGARRLYLRQGYRDWGREGFVSSWQTFDDLGRARTHSHFVTYMTKSLLIQEHRAVA